MITIYVAKITYEASYYMQDSVTEREDIRIVHAESEEEAFEKIRSHEDYQNIEFEMYVRIIEIDLKSPIM